ncbi:MAG: L,D-transpeptidase family protein [Byssovorax sp.]
MRSSLRTGALMFVTAFAATGLLLFFPRGTDRPANAIPATENKAPLPSAAPVRAPAAPPPAQSAPAAPSVTAAPEAPESKPASSPADKPRSRSPAAALTAPLPYRTTGDSDPGDLDTLPPELADEGPEEAVVEEPSTPKPDPKAREVDELASISRETWVFAEPNWKSRKLGYLRAGAIVPRAATPAVKNAGCPDGWYWIEPRGYVCVGTTATLNIFDPVVETSKRRPKMDGLPYTYVMSRFPPPTFYSRLPSRSESGIVETDILNHLQKAAQFVKDPDYVEPPPAEPVPGVLLYNQQVPGLNRLVHAPASLQVGTAKTHSGFALLSTFDYEGRRFGLTTDLMVIPIDRTRVIKESTFAGISLDDEVTLPVAFVKVKHATRYTLEGTGALKAGAALGYREAVPINAAEKRIGGTAYFEAKDGSLIRVDQAVKIDRLKRAPAWATGSRKWVDVSILKQSLVAYEGKKPVYVTLVSTGVDGLGDPRKSHSTILGAFLIHTKHVSVTMDDDKKGDVFDFRDVPYVQYFTEGFALHAAYWHDEFGTPYSHGCVNLSPRDAAKIFSWTGPEVPPGWHAALSARKGTLVYTHP